MTGARVSIACRRLMRHLGVFLALVRARLAALADLAISNLRSQAEQPRAAQIAFQQLAEDSHHLNELVLEWAGPGEPPRWR
jgi:hypothetical protein